MKSLVYAVECSAGAEMLNRIMDVSAHIRKDKRSLLESVTHFHEGPKCAQITREFVSNNYLISISISNS
jgi:hypothetical protein